LLLLLLTDCEKKKKKKNKREKKKKTLEPDVVGLDVKEDQLVGNVPYGRCDAACDDGGRAGGARHKGR